MSDVMLFGVLRMPYDLTMSSELSRRQFYGRAQEAADRIELLEAEVEKLRTELATRCRVEGGNTDQVGRAALAEFIEKYCLNKPELVACAESAFYWFNECLSGVSAPAAGTEKDAERFRFAIALEDNAETLCAAVMNNAPDGNPIRAQFDAAILAHTKAREGA